MQNDSSHEFDRRGVLAAVTGLAAATFASTAAATSTSTGGNATPVQRRPITFPNRQITMAGELFLPAGFVETARYPAVVCTHPAGSVKEQSPANYAIRLAAQGFVVLTFDASHQGASGGEPRWIENPSARAEDVRCAVDCLITLPFVAIDRIGAMGICAGAGYTLTAAITDRRIKAIGGVSPTDAGSAIREGWDGQMPVAEQLKMLESATAQRSAEVRGAPTLYMPYVPETVDANTPVTYAEGHDYYRTPRAQHPRSPNKVTATSLHWLLTYSATDRIDTLLTQPLLMVLGSRSDAARFPRKILQLAASQDKQLQMIDGATHIDLYDRPPYVDQAVRHLAGFFTAKL